MKILDLKVVQTYRAHLFVDPFLMIRQVAALYITFNVERRQFHDKRGSAL